MYHVHIHCVHTVEMHCDSRWRSSCPLNYMDLIYLKFRNRTTPQILGVWFTQTSLSLPRRTAPSAEFSVDRTRHIMSFLTMLGPSPDWNVGLSAEDLCTKECGWVQKVVQDLIPWDAGTDSGVTYEVSMNICKMLHAVWIQINPTLTPWSFAADSCLHTCMLTFVSITTFSSSACLLTSTITPALTFSHTVGAKLFTCHHPSNSLLTALNAPPWGGVCSLSALD